MRVRGRPANALLVATLRVTSENSTCFTHVPPILLRRFSPPLSRPAASAHCDPLTPASSPAPPSSESGRQRPGSLGPARAGRHVTAANADSSWGGLSSSGGLPRCAQRGRPDESSQDGRLVLKQSPFSGPPRVAGTAPPDPYQPSSRGSSVQPAGLWRPAPRPPVPPTPTSGRSRWPGPHSIVKAARAYASGDAPRACPRTTGCFQDLHHPGGAARCSRSGAGSTGTGMASARKTACRSVSVSTWSPAAGSGSSWPRRSRNSSA